MKRLIWPLVLVLALSLGYYLIPHNQTGSPDDSRRFDIPTIPATNTDGWQMYNNSKYGYTFYYPTGWEVYGTGDRIMLANPDEAAATKRCIAAGSQEPCGPTQVGSAYFEVMTGKPGTHSRGKHVSTTLNGMRAQFYIDPVVTERNYWVINEDGVEFLVAAITDKEVKDQYQQTALAIANTFTLN